MRVLACVLGLTVVVAACTGSKNGGSGTPTPTATAQVRLWNEDVAPLVMQNCAGCHQPGGIAPFSLLTYADAHAVGVSMKAVTGNRSMPPEVVDVSGACHDYTNGRYLTDAEIKVFSDWVDTGMGEGNPANAPPSPTPIPTLANVTHTVDIGFDYTPTVGGNDDYHCFVVDPGAGANEWLSGFEVVPGNKTIVHHVVLFAMNSAQADADAATNDTNDASEGYGCFGGVNVSDSSLILAWAPGGGPLTLPAGTAMQLQQGRKLVIQVHYNTTNGTGQDRTAIKLATTNTAPSKPAVMGFLAQSFSPLTQGMTDVSYSYDVTVPGGQGGLIYSVFPHMHRLGTNMSLELIHNGATSCMADVPRWNFNWQEFHEYTAPIAVAAGDTLRVTCHWNTTSVTAPVSFGENTDNEMCVFGYYATGP